MTSVEVANQGDVEALVELEGLLLAEDVGVHDAHADVTCQADGNPDTIPQVTTIRRSGHRLAALVVD